MSAFAIRVGHIGKRYRIGERELYKTLREVLTDTLYARFRLSSFVLHPSTKRHGQRSETDGWIWALKDVFLEVKCGESVGIVGRNGSGKSTMLKILSRVTKPTKGYAEIYGRVASLLEVGTGFHPELTGRENIYLNGAILGMKKVEINRKFDEIVDFAEIEKFLDTPVKRYSSGMYVRLAFAVAAHLEPEILLVDEVLAVGDAAFQKKCLGKMSNVAQEGRTVLFVSHNMAAVQSLCGRVIWLHDGRLVEEGQPAEVVSHYLQTSFSALTEQVWNDKATAPGNDKVRLRRACVHPLNGSPSDPITIRTPFLLEFEYWNLRAGAHLNPSLRVYNEQGIMVFNSVPVKEPVWWGRPFPIAFFRSVCHVPGDLLNDGMHRVELFIIEDQGKIIYRQVDILVFDVRDAVEMREAWFHKSPGVVRPNLEWSTKLIEADKPPAA